jgi:hypothetical protein
MRAVRSFAASRAMRRFSTLLKSVRLSPKIRNRLTNSAASVTCNGRSVREAGEPDADIV